MLSVATLRLSTARVIRSQAPVVVVTSCYFYTYLPCRPQECPMLYLFYIILIRVFYIILIYLAGIKSVLPEIIPSKPFLRVDERNSFTIKCQARTGDFQHLAWYKNGRTQDLPVVLTRNKHNITSTLTIGHAQLDDAGEYLCHGYGWTANETKISVINVSVTGMTMSFF